MTGRRGFGNQGGGGLVARGKGGSMTGERGEEGGLVLVMREGLVTREGKERVTDWGWGRGYWADSHQPG